MLKEVGKGAIEHTFKKPTIGMEFTVIVLKTLGRISDIFVHSILISQ